MLKLMLTHEQEMLLLQLPESVLQVFADYPSAADNYLRVKDEPPLPDEYKSGVFEFYYDCEPLPVITIDNGAISINKRTSKEPPKVIEVMTDLDIAFIQVAGKVITNRLGNTLPDIAAVLVEV